MSYYILIRGALGIGKSTISKKLAKILNAEYISMDEVLEKNKLDIPSKKEGCIPAKNFIKANDIILPIILKRLEEGKIVIFDGCFYHKEQIEHLKKNLPGKHYAFTLKAPLEACIERDSKRENVYGEGAATAVHNLVSRFDYGKVIDTHNKTVDQVVKKILSYIS